MVDEVVARERGDELGLAPPVGGGDGDELAVAGGGGNRLRPCEQSVAVRREQRRRDEDQRVVARGRLGDDRGDRRVVAHHEPAEQVRCVHVTTLEIAADTALTPRRRLGPCWRSPWSGPSRCAATACCSGCRAARRRSCSRASLSRRARRGAPAGWSTARGGGEGPTPKPFRGRARGRGGGPGGGGGAAAPG